MKKSIYVIIGILLIASSYFFYNRIQLIESGYCSAKDGYLSDEEYIQVALAGNAYSIKDYGNSVLSGEYAKVNPSCCSVYHDASSWANILLNHYFVLVELNYELKPEYAQHGFPFYEDYVSVSACGVVLDNYGQANKELKDANTYK